MHRICLWVVSFPADERGGTQRMRILGFFDIPKLGCRIICILTTAN